MGKKKSVALIVIVTVVLLGLLFISITPTFPVKTPYSLQSLLNTVRLGADLGGGYGAVYYPEGVISAEEYAGEVARYESGEGTDPAEQYVANGGVYLVPAFSGLGAPYFNDKARAAIIGMDRSTRPAHLVRAAEECIAYQIADNVNLLSRSAGIPVRELRVASVVRWLPTWERRWNRASAFCSECSILTATWPGLTLSSRVRGTPTASR